MKGLSLFVLVALLLTGPAVGWAQSPPPGQAPAGSSPAAPAQPGGSPPATPPGATVPDSTTPKTQAPPAPGGTVPDSTTPKAQAPATPGGTAPETTSPRAQTPSPGVPSDRADTDSRILGLSPLAATILGLVVLGLIIALVVGMGRRDRDVIVSSHIEPGVGPDRPVDTYESEIERERRRRAS